jgi:DNA/RNA-binding domain of Phe-tRNA-synthetase-like protein
MVFERCSLPKIFFIEESFANLFPEAKIGIIIARGISNRRVDGFDYAGLLDEGRAEARRHLNAPDFPQNPVIAEWREAFKKFKTKKGARSSIEALLKRVSSGNPVGSINPLVNLYNFISMKYAIPCGGETLSSIEGDLRLTVATGGEQFLPLGAEVDEPALSGEVIYRDDFGAVCRCFNWREAQRTMLTEQTTDAILIMELVDRTRTLALEAALNELAGLIRTNLGGRTEVHLMHEAGCVGIEA